MHRKDKGRIIDLSQNGDVYPHLFFHASPSQQFTNRQFLNNPRLAAFQENPKKINLKKQIPTHATRDP